MVGLIKSDLYKLFRMKSFYICGALAAAFAGLNIFLLNYASKIQYVIYGIEDMFVSPYTGVYSFGFGLTVASLFTIIITSMFIQSEFKFGTMKNIVSRGLDRFSIYFSKFIATTFISFVYMLACGIASFAVGCCLAGVGEFDRSIFLDILAIFGLCLLAQIALQSIFQMVGFFARGTGWAIGINIAIYLVLPFVFKYVDLLVNNWLANAISSVEWLSNWIKIEDFSIAKYWPDGYMSQFSIMDYLHMDFFRETLITGIIVCVAYIVVSSILGSFVFSKRDID